MFFLILHPDDMFKLRLNFNQSHPIYDYEKKNVIAVIA